MAFSLVSNKLHIPFPFHPISHALWGPRHQTWLQRSTAQDGSGVLTSAARFDPCGMEWEAPRPVFKALGLKLGNYLFLTPIVGWLGLAYY